MKRQAPRIHDQLTSFKPLDKYSFKERLMIRTADLGLYSLLSVIARTLRFDAVEGWSGLDREGWESYESAYERFPNIIGVFWHDRLFMMSAFWQEHETGMLCSESLDGEIAARIAQRFGCPVVRGSSTRGGSKALRQMVELCRRGTNIGITIDGPRGPKYRAKSGPVMLAAKTGLPIVPMLAEAKTFWEVNSWDNLRVPRPFTRAKMFVAEPVFVSEEEGRNCVSAKREEIQKKLDDLTLRGEEWRKSG